MNRKGGVSQRIEGSRQARPLVEDLASRGRCYEEKCAQLLGVITVEMCGRRKTPGLMLTDCSSSVHPCQLWPLHLLGAEERPGEEAICVPTLSLLCGRSIVCSFM